MEKNSDRFYGDRLRIARTFKALTQAELGEKVSASAAFICQLEAGRKQPTDPLLQALSEALGFAPSFFTQPVGDEFRDEECNFRRRKTTPQYLRNQVLAHGTLFGAVVEHLDERLSLPSPNIPDVPVNANARREEIERAAEKARLHWGLGLDVPITNMTRVLERAGVVVTRFAGIGEKIDAFSRAGVRDVVVLNPSKDSPSRSRFDLAHECGHLVMHRGMETGTPEREEQANHFAAAFLLPRAGFVREYGHRPRIQWAHLRQLNKRWGVSLAAIVRRAYDLQLIDAREYRRAYKYIHAKGWHKGEPDEPPEEKHEVIPLAFQALERLSKKTTWHLAADLDLEPLVLEKLTGVHVPVQDPTARRLRLAK
jgi:Zn-dependent peptidase ImmA (M78 family)/DNA-binding XRE family transcriptional regulator